MSLRQRHRTFSGALLPLLAMLVFFPASVGATELALRPHAISLSAGTEGGALYLSRGTEARAGWVGARYQLASRGVGVPLGFNQEVLSRVGRPLHLRAELTPMLLTRDHLTPALGATLGLDQRFVGRTLLASLGLEVDYAAQAPLERFEHRTNLLLTGGLGHRFAGVDLWITAHAGYTLGGQGGGGLVASLSIGMTLGRFIF
ncbi:hypothetical protein FRC98_12155 [Lujinxingia vulgaris]|uniref:Uncharacterized protein n=1 Tax=Lujinxingia vulgaris TaxID=2600176 RepID=A0A5C6XA37_9DELT|nr:hypothetical protein [Lujinxingia vulgaris]TXD36583.1 hypothetical protein FRC98_12155 [Lujinxingia vulgaris]